MTMKKIIYMAALAMTFIACSNEDDIVYTNKDIKIQTTIGTMTKTTVDAQGAAKFVKGDEFSFYAWDGTFAADNTPWISNVKIMLDTDGKTWMPEKQILWKTAETKHDFLGIYPASLITETTDLAKVEYTMSSGDNTTAYDDILRAYSPEVVMPESNTLTLPFKHVMAKLRVNLKFRNQWDEAPEVSSVAPQIVYKADINFYTGEVKPSTNSNYYGRVMKRMQTPANDYVYSYEVIAVPDDEGFVKIEIQIPNGSVTDNDTYTFINDETISLISGKVTTVNLIVGRNKVELVTPAEGEEGGITIDDWTDNTTYDGDAL